ncbi:MAG: NAD(P)/FAD-dependent oxidoreductase [Lactovum sp.]
MKIFDVVIVGAGPVGLYACYYAGLRGLSVHLVENFSELGGQPVNLYPEKNIFDIAGLPQVTGRQLTENLLKQLEQINYSFSTSERIEKIEKKDEIFSLQSKKGEVQAHAVLLTTGKGFLIPRKLGIENEEIEAQKGRVSYSVSNLEEYKGKKLAVFGGGDSALDWALMLEEYADEVHLIHRRNEFRALKKHVEDLKKSTIRVHTPYKFSELTEKELHLEKLKSDEKIKLEVDQLLVFYGFLIESSKIVENLEMTKQGKIPVIEGMQTNISGLYAAGDVTEYDGKVELMSVGFGEAVLAINDMTQKINFDHKIRNGYSSTIFEQDK